MISHPNLKPKGTASNCADVIEENANAQPTAGHNDEPLKGKVWHKPEGIDDDVLFDVVKAIRRVSGA